MSTDAKPKPKARPRPPAAPKPVVTFPMGTETMLSRQQVHAALGISLRAFQSMLAAGEYPRPDTYLGALPRWRVVTHNAWVQARCARKEG